MRPFRRPRNPAPPPATEVERLLAQLQALRPIEGRAPEFTTPAPEHVAPRKPPA